MDFRKELAKELGLGVISENTMLDDYVKACEAIAFRYHEREVKKFRLGGVSGSVCRCKRCNCEIRNDVGDGLCAECWSEN